ncbi:MAG TPA: hypothetical protein VET85_12620 [Stellaceae bacterium]|nr:hypothetical protein [Stellaceae bacterium]
MDCTCDRCQKFCRTKPGWFAPAQIAPLAAALGLTVEGLFRRYLTIDTVLVGDGDEPSAIYVLAPAMAESGAGELADPTAKGTCVWFKDGRCAIHTVKPTECALQDHTTTPQVSNLRRAAIAKQWQPVGALVQDLYGKPLAPPEALRNEYRQARARRKAAQSGAS